MGYKKSFSESKLCDYNVDVFGVWWLYFRLHGLLPFCVLRTPDGEFTYKFSKSGILCTVANMLIMAVTATLCIRKSQRAPFSVASEDTSWMDSVNSMVSIGVGPISLVFHLTKFRRFADFAGNILQLDRKLQSQTGIKPKPVAFAEHAVFLVTPTLSLFCGMGTAILLGAVVAIPPEFFTATVLSRSIAYVLLHQMVMALVIIKSRFAILNRLVSSCPMSTRVSNRRRANIRLPPKIIQDFTLSEVPVIHSTVVKCLTMLNESFSKAMVVNVIAVFVDSVYILFLQVRFILTPHGHIQPAAFWTMSMMCCLNITNLVVVLLFCRRMELEAKRTPKCIHKAYNKTSDTENKAKLILFSKQLIGVKFGITASGLFPMDFSVLYSMIGAISIYLAILVQLQFN